MAANPSNGSENYEGNKSSLITLKKDGSNLVKWNASLQAMFSGDQSFHFMIAAYNMFVDPSKTLAIQMESRLEANLSSARKVLVDSSKFEASIRTMTAKTPDIDKPNFDPSTPAPKEDEESGDTRGEVSMNTSLRTPSTRPHAPRGSSLRPSMADSATTATFRRASAHVSHSRATRMKRNAALILSDSHKYAGLPLGYGYSCFLDPCSALEMDPELDELARGEGCIYEHTGLAKGSTTMRYCVESAKEAALRARTDDKIKASLINIPTHYTLGVIGGDIFTRVNRVNTGYGEVTRANAVSATDSIMRSIVKKQGEPWTVFDSRFREVLTAIHTHNIQVDCDLVLTHLKRAISSGGDTMCINVFQHVQMVTQASTCEELLDAMKTPMYTNEQIALANSHHVLVATAGVRDTEESKTSHVPKNPCLTYSQGKECQYGKDCRFEHVKLGPDQLKALEEKVASAKLRFANTGGKGKGRARGKGSGRGAGKGGRGRNMHEVLLASLNTPDSHDDDIHEAITRMRKDGLKDEHVRFFAKYLQDQGNDEY
jgi:hypothetical protein